MSIEILRDALARNQVIIVAGTGVSAAISDNAPTSTWLGLIEDGIRRVDQMDPDRGALLQLRLEAFRTSQRLSDLTGIATEVRQELEHGDDKFGRWLDTALGNIQAKHDAVPKSLAALGAPILTTNYDTLIERSLALSSITWSDPDAMRKIALGDLTKVGHLHGLYSDAKTVVFSDTDYRRVMANTAAQAVQTSAFNMLTFLFVGFGAGMSDPNFKLMIDNFGSAFRGTAAAHFRLCTSGEVRPESDLAPVADISYGDDFADLPGFLQRLKPDRTVAVAIDKRARSLDSLLNRVRDNSTLWRDNESLEQKTITELIVPPVFLPEPHDQYATNSVLENERAIAEPIDIASAIESSSFLLIVGEENAGVSTAVAWVLNEALSADPTLHSHLIDDPITAGPKPITKKLTRSYRNWGIDPFTDADLSHCVLGVDNFRFETSEKFDRAVSDLASRQTRLTVIGVRQQDALEVANALSENGAQNVTLAHLGRFSDTEAQEIARRVSPGSETRVVTAVMIVIREKRLPRNPFTITLLIELIRSGSKLKDQESEIAVLDHYLDLLLIGDFFRSTHGGALTLRNKRVVLVALARKLVELKEDKAKQADFVKWIEELFEELGWPYDALACIEDLVRRRVLSKGPNNTIRFQRSAYLELMAGIAAQEDVDFRKLVFSAPLELASIVRTYAAMSRNDADVLRLMETQIDLINVVAPTGAVFGGIRQLEAPNKLFSDHGEAVGGESEDTANGVERDKLTNNYYDGTDDTDRPTFLAARIEDLPPARVAMLVVDLASRVLRDTDEIRDQSLKARLLQKLLVAWVSFLDLFEAELRAAPDLDDAVRTLYKGDNPTEKELDSFKAALLRITPSYYTFTGVSYCLSGPSLVPLLGSVEVQGFTNSEYAGLIRTLALYASGSTTWVKSLGSLEQTAVKSWFSASFLSSIARYAYISDRRLTEADGETIREYLRQAIGLRYSFNGVDHKNKIMNSFEDGLRKAQLNESMRSPRSITVLG